MTSRLSSRAALGAAALLTLGAAPDVPAGARLQPPAAPHADLPADSSAPAAARVPWSVGERLGYDVKYGAFRVGRGSLEVPEVAEVRGRPAYHTVLKIQGRALLYSVSDTFESWIDTTALTSLRFYQTQLEGGKTRNKRYEIFPERETYQDGTKAEERSVADPLDDGSLLYVVRTLPLRPDDVYELNRYFKPDRNPVRIRVVRREQVSVPAGTFNAIVVAPTIKTKGIFSEGGRAEVWLSDDADRVMLQMKSSLPFGSITLQLRSREGGRKAS